MIEVAIENTATSVNVLIHYFLADADMHSMNAEVFNNCERQLIKAIKSVSKFLDGSIEIEVFAREEGGVLGKLKIDIPTLVATVLITGAINTFFTANIPQKLTVAEEVNLQVDTYVALKEALNAGTLTEEEVTVFLNKDKGLQKLKSNFFKSAKQEENLTQIEVATDTKVNGEYVFDKITVPYNKFNNFILTDDEESDMPVDNEIKAKVYIIAPILVHGKKYNWKGIIEGEAEPIDFPISDKTFLEKVYNKEIEFKNGTYIVCKMKIITVSNLITGKETITRDVFDVENCGDDDKVIQIIKQKKKTEQSGPYLFEGMEQKR